MAYRVRQVATVKYGHFGAFFATVKKGEAIAHTRGWAPARVLVPTAGQDNQIIIEREYPDLAAFQAENDAFYSDEEAFTAFREGADHVVDGSSRTELLQDVPMDFPGSD